MRSGSVLKGNAVFEKYIRKNFIKYIVILAVYLVGFIIGIGMFNKNINIENQSNKISEYIIDSINEIGMDNNQITTEYIKQDFYELLIICILSFSIIGIPIIIIILFLKALSLGVTVSALVYTGGAGWGMSFSILVFLIPTIIKIFVVLIMVCSSIKFIENILQYKKEVRYELVRHALVNFISFIATCGSIIYRAFSLNIVNQILF